jgi:hypothetical protein
VSDREEGMCRGCIGMEDGTKGVCLPVCLSVGLSVPVVFLDSSQFRPQLKP